MLIICVKGNANVDVRDKYIYTQAYMHTLKADISGGRRNS
jgi:hypothetical protein